jgi:tetratricopeptide (TPR) repeat protein
MAAVFHLRRAYDQAIEQARKTIELDATFRDAHLMLAVAYLQKGMLDEALAEGEKAAALPGRSAVSLSCIGGCYAALGRTNEAKRIIAELTELSMREHVSSFFIAWVCANLRDKEAALAHLEQAYLKSIT